MIETWFRRMTAKRVGIYNRWLTTLGGGEKYSLSIASYIGRFHDVEVISHKPIPKEKVAERLDLDLSNISLKFIPELSVIELPQITKEYDLFINASFMDFYPSLAKLSAYIIYFPDKLGLKSGYPPLDQGFFTQPAGYAHDGCWCLQICFCLTVV